MPVFDAALEATVVGSYTCVGSALRRRLYHWDGTGQMTGRTVVVTGATSGIGRAAALGFAAAGARVCLVGRDPDRLDSSRRQVTEVGGEVTVEVADLEDLVQVQALADRMAARLPGIDVMVNNAGALFRARRTVAGGREATVALNLLSPYLLTELLLPALVAAGGRVITMTSAGLYTQRFELSSLVMGGEGYDGAVAYARAKRALVVLTEEWQRRYGHRGVAFHSVHPGWADTPGLAQGLPGFARVMKPWLRSPAAGADTAVWLASRPHAADGRAAVVRPPAPLPVPAAVDVGVQPATPGGRGRLVELVPPPGRAIGGMAVNPARGSVAVIGAGDLRAHRRLSAAAALRRDPLRGRLPPRRSRPHPRGHHPRWPEDRRRQRVHRLQRRDLSTLHPPIGRVGGRHGRHGDGHVDPLRRLRSGLRRGAGLGRTAGPAPDVAAPPVRPHVGRGGALPAPGPAPSRRGRWGAVAGGLSRRRRILRRTSRPTTYFLVVSAVWSASPSTAREYPARYLFRFLDNHGMLSMRPTLRWRTIPGGARRYVEQAAKNLTAVNTHAPVRSIRRHSGSVEVRDEADHSRRFDGVVVATHADTALSLLVDPTPQERSVLGAFGYSVNDTILHTDARLLPRQRAARVSWNYLLPSCGADHHEVIISYYMNRLQGLQTTTDYLVSLNARSRVNPDSVVRRMSYRHPRLHRGLSRRPGPPACSQRQSRRLCRRLPRVGIP